MASNHLKTVLTDALRPIMQEMMERIEGEWSDSDLSAIQAAISKAAIEGAHCGMSEAAAQIAEQQPGIVLKGLDSLKLTLPDPWAERYGEDEG